MATHRDDIDGLRALAVLPIVLFHLGVPGFGGGYVGVDIFFVISGFLITRNLAGGQSIGEFYERRARRILPALLVMLAVTTAIALVVLMPRDLAAFGRSLLGTLLFASNVQFWLDVGYFDEQAFLKPLLHTWSLAVEEQFYLAFPLFLIAARRWLRGMFWPVAVVGLVSFALCVAWTLKRPSTAFYLPMFRGWELLLGAVLALGRWPAARAWEAPLGFALLLLAVFAYDEGTRFPGGAALAPCLGAALLLHAGQTSLAAPLRLKPLAFFGKVSYSLYLWHWPLVVFYIYLWGKPGPAAIVALFGLMVLLAWASFTFVEEPVRQRRALPRIALPAVGAVAAGLLVGVLALDGMPARYGPQIASLEAAASDRSADPRRCHNRTPQQVAAGELCVIGAAGATPTWLLWGDSHGRAMQDFYAAALQQTGQAALVATRDGCVPLLGVSRLGYDHCGAFTGAVAQLAQQRELRPILVGHWAGYLDQHLQDGQPGTAEEVLARGVKRTPYALIMDPVPGALASVPRGLAQRAAYGWPQRIALEREDYLQRNRAFLIAVDGRPRVSLWRELCASGTCAVEREGKALYFDSNHPAASAFGFSVPHIADALRQASGTGFKSRAGTMPVSPSS